MAITVREALGLGALQKARLVAGHGGIDRIIRCVDVLEVPDPTGWLRPDEFLVTACYAIRHNLEAQLNLVEQMAKVNGAALAVKFGRFVGEIPAEMCRLADEYQLPLIDVPNEVLFMDITHPVMTAIVNEQSRRLEYSVEVHRKLTRVALEANSLLSVARTLNALINRTIVICDEELRVQAESGRGPSSEEYLIPPEELHKLKQNGRYVEISVWNKSIRRKYAAFPIYVRNRCYGYLLAEVQDLLSEMQLIAIEHAIIVTALQMVKEEQVREAQLSTRRDLFEDLISGVIADKAAALSRAEAAGVFLDEPKALMVVDVDDFTGYLLRQPGNQEKHAEILKRNLYRIVSDGLQSYSGRCLVVQRSDSIVAVIPANCRKNGPSNAKNMRTLIMPFIQAMQRRIAEAAADMTVTFAISSVVSDPLDIGRIYQDVQSMIALTRKMRGDGQIVFWEDAEIYLVLGQMGQTLQRFYQSVLGELEQVNLKNRHELLETLRVYLECQGNTIEAAEKLYVHRNTLRYRLQRIEQILGRDLSLPDERFSLWLALKARTLLKQDD